NYGLTRFFSRRIVALEHAFKSLLCFPCLMCIMCLKDTCTLEEKMLQDSRRLYTPGRLYHIIVRKPFRTVVPVDGRFEYIVLSCNIISDHAIIWILHESQRTLNMHEYMTAIKRAVALEVPHANSPPSYGTFHESEEGENSN
ncbi:hypothetical protein MIMGU_mgv1a025648mg, partial [Erythranthe guttata]